MHTTKANTDRWRTRCQEVDKIGWRLPIRQAIQKPIAGDVVRLTPIRWLRKDRGTIAVKEKKTLLSHLARQPLGGKWWQVQNLLPRLVCRRSNKLPEDLKAHN